MSLNWMVNHKIVIQFEWPQNNNKSSISFGRQIEKKGIKFNLIKNFGRNRNSYETKKKLINRNSLFCFFISRYCFKADRLVSTTTYIYNKCQEFFFVLF